jgi:uncharacterized membrane-anchored protein
VTGHASQPVRTLMAGAIVICILSGMIVLHAWPLWFGQTALLPVTPIDPRDPFRGEYVQLRTPATNLFIQTKPGPSPDAAVAVTPVGDWWEKFPAMRDWERHRAIYGMTIYVQLEPDHSAGEYRAVSISDRPVRGALNLRGRVDSLYATNCLRVSYGLDAYFMQEGTAKPVEDALRNRRKVQMEIAIAESGHARIRRVLVDGVPVGP